MRIARPLSLIMALSLAPAACSAPDRSADGGGGGEGGEGEGDGFQGLEKRIGDPAFEEDVFIKDGIQLRYHPDPNPILAVVFTRPAEAGGARELYLYRGGNAEDGTVTKIRLRDFGAPTNPYVSSGGEWAVFFNSGGTGIGISDLRIADESGATRALVRARGGQQVRNPVISAQGDFLAYQLDEGGAKKILHYDIQLDQTRAVWEIEGNTGFPAMSDNGDLVYFHTDGTQKGDHEIVRWSRETETPENISNKESAQDQFPSASRDGEVVCWRRSSQAANVVGHIFVWADRVVRSITDGFGLNYLNHFDCRPDASGRHLIFRSHPGEIQRHLWLRGGIFWRYDMNAHDHERLPDVTGVDPGQPFSPWRVSSDGRYVVFAGFANGSSQMDIFALDLTSGSTYNLTNSPESEGSGAPGVN